MRPSDLHGDGDRTKSTNKQTSCIGIFGAPKSASTFIWRVFLELTGRQGGRYTLDNSGLGLHELDVDRIADQWRQNGAWISHSHVTASPYTLAVIARFDATSIVTVRNLLDTVVSLREEWLRQWQENSANLLPDGSGSVQFLGLVPITSVQHFMASSAKSQTDFVIETVCAWYARFIEGWRIAARKQPDKICLSAYEDLLEGEVAQLFRLAQFANLETTVERVEQACATVKGNKSLANYNIGKRGRGDKTLSSRQVHRVRTILEATGTEKELIRYLTADAAFPNAL